MSDYTISATFVASNQNQSLSSRNTLRLHTAHQAICHIKHGGKEDNNLGASKDPVEAAPWTLNSSTEADDPQEEALDEITTSDSARTAVDVVVVSSSEGPS